MVERHKINKHITLFSLGSIYISLILAITHIFTHGKCDYIKLDTRNKVKCNNTI